MNGLEVEGKAGNFCCEFSDKLVDELLFSDLTHLSWRIMTQCVNRNETRGSLLKEIMGIESSILPFSLFSLSYFQMTGYF